MRMTTGRQGRRVVSAGVLLLGGSALAIAVWVSGDHGFAVGAAVAYLVLAGIAYRWAGGSGDVAAVLRMGSDERQRGLDRDATAITAVAMSVTAIVGALVQVVRTGNTGAYGVMCVVSAVSYAVSFFILRRRR